MLQFCDRGSLSQVKALWKQAFGDSEAAIELYFQSFHRNENMLLDTCGGIVRAMLSMLPLELHMAGKVLPARYVFAVATHRDYQKQGISTHLVKQACQYMQEQGTAAALLVPARPELFAFYQRCGFCTQFYLKRVPFSPVRTVPHGLHMSDCSSADYYRIRQMTYGACIPFAAWEPASLDFIMRYMRLYGDMFFRFTSGTGGEAALYCRRQQDTLIVKEIATGTIAQEQILHCLAERVPAARYEVQLPAGPESGYPFGMLRSFTAASQFLERPYFNLAMD